MKVDAKLNDKVNETNREIMVTRLVSAPRELVWRAFTDAQHIHSWWGPNGFTTTTSEMEVRVGGLWRYVMHGPDGVNYTNWIRYTKVVPHSRLEYEHGGDDPENAVFTAAAELEARGSDKTQVTLRLLFATAELRDEMAKFGAQDGGGQTLGRLDAFVSNGEQHFSGAMTLNLLSDCEFIVTRSFKAPRERVFEAWTKREDVMQWYAHCGKMTMSACDIDLRVGGKWRYALHMNDNGSEHSFSGEYRVVDKPQRLAYVERYEQMPGTDHTVSLIFAEQGGVTTLSIHSLYPTKEMRDGHVQSGMEAGMRETLDQLDELVSRKAQ
jgi:uncharacterized protein YndB with AHSA1/START domain